MKKVLGAVIFFALFVPLHSLQWVIDSVDVAILWPGSSLDIAVESDGTPHLVNGAHPGLLVRYAVKVEEDWVIEDVDTYGGLCASIALDSEGRPHLAYMKGSQSFLIHAYFNDTNWEYDTVDYMHSDTKSEMEIDSSGVVHIVYGEYDGSYRLKHAWLEAGTWHTEFVDQTTGSGNDLSLALDASGNPHISHFRAPNGANPPWEEVYSYQSGGSWTNIAFDASIGNYNVITSGIALDTEGHPHIVYFNHDMFSPSLRYAFWDGISWNIETIDDNFPWFGGGDCDILLDSDDGPHVVYSTYYQQIGGDSELRYAYRGEGGEWVIETIDSELDAGEINALAIDGMGRLHLAYFRGDGNTQDGYIMYARSTSPVVASEGALALVSPSRLFAYPNPFTSELFGRIEGAVGTPSVVIYDPSGRLVRVIVPHATSRGTYTWIWRGEGNGGVSLPAGPYILRVTDSRKMPVIVKVMKGD